MRFYRTILETCYLGDACNIVAVDVGPQRGGSCENSSLKMDLYAALALLKPDERTCITLQLIDGYDIAGIAKITGLKDGTVKSHLSRGKEKLTTYLKQNGYDR